MNLARPFQMLIILPWIVAMLPFRRPQPPPPEVIAALQEWLRPTTAIVVFSLGVVAFVLFGVWASVALFRFRRWGRPAYTIWALAWVAWPLLRYWGIGTVQHAPPEEALVGLYHLCNGILMSLAYASRLAIRFDGRDDQSALERDGAG